MKYKKQLEKLKKSEYSREAILKLKSNAERLVATGDFEAQVVLDAIDISTPSDQYILFMGFCPGGNFENRQDLEWKEKGICTFDYIESESQVNRFNDVYPGDLVVLKKREKFGKTMKLFGHGRVKSVSYNDDGIKYLNMDWSSQNEVIEVPLMGCNSTVDIRDIITVNKEMPEDFFTWLEKK